MSEQSIEYSQVPKKSWKPDNEVKTCFGCGIIFTIFRRRHHCRYCGLIFCSKCLLKKNHSMKTKTLTKICQECLQLIQKIEEKSVKKSNTSILSSPLLTELSPESLSASIKSEDLQLEKVFTQTNNLSKEILKIQNALNAVDEFSCEKFSEFLKEKAKILVRDEGISEDFIETIIALVEGAVSSVCNSVQYRGDFMDLTKYIRIQKLICDEKIFTNFFSGVAFPKNLASKKMQKFMQNPRILLVKVIRENHEIGILSMKKLIQDEAIVNSMILGKIMNCKPDILVCRESLTQSLINELANREIIAIVNVKNKIMNLIARATSGKILNSCDETRFEKKFIGQCGSFFLETRGECKIAHFTGQQDRSATGTIFISGPCKIELAKLKRILRSLIIDYRNIKLENCLFKMFTLEITDNIFLKIYEKEAVFKHFILSENNMCTKPETVNIKFYTVNDMAVGEFFVKVIEKIQEKCVECESAWGNHQLYYFKADGWIKIRFSKSKIKDEGIRFNRECKICGKFEKSINTISGPLWEYSFYKFLNNFFKKVTTFSNSISCQHNFFKYSKMLFFLNQIKITLEWEENIAYRVIHLTEKPDISNFQVKALYRIVTETTRCAIKLMENMIESSKELIVEIDNYSSEKGYKELYWKGINSQITENMEKITILLVKIYEMQPENFSSYFEATTERNRIFLKICKFTKVLDSLQVTVKQKKKNSKGAIDESITEQRLAQISDGEYMMPLRSQTLDVRKINEKQVKNVEKPLSDEFLQLQKGNQTLAHGQNKLFIPVSEDQPLSIIAHALNSLEYYNEILLAMPNKDNINSIESSLLNCDEKHFQYNFSTLNTKKLKNYSKKEDLVHLYGDLITFNLHIFYPKQFQIIRNSVTGNNLNFIQSIINSESVKEQLGKSKAYFSKSLDNLYIIKILDEKEFTMFKELAPNYFRHFCNAEYHKMPCCMVRTLGCFRIYTKNYTKGTTRIEWALLFENLGCVMPKEVEVYDLKGSFNERRYVGRNEKKTKMDRNFLEDFKGIPIKISKEAKKLLDMSIWNDTLFLAKQNIVDYSLLIMISTKDRTLTYGIIDYVAKYTLEKVLENKYKGIVGTDIPTITNPSAYKKRFRDTISNRIFIEFNE